MTFNEDALISDLEGSGILLRLKSSPLVEDIKKQLFPGVTELDFVQWERDNSPYILPDDLRNLYSIFNGFDISYRFSDSSMQGSMRLNLLSEIKQYHPNAKEESWLCDSYETDEDGNLTESPNIRVSMKNFACFKLDSSLTNSNLLMVYHKNRIDTPQFYLQSRDCLYYYITDSFSNFFRLIFQYCGMVDWYNDFTPLGLNTFSISWLRILNPQRLARRKEKKLNHTRLNKGRIHKLFEREVKMKEKDRKHNR
ncbi:hypothetical protein PCE1_002001 [Barthelona sp. PCE]